MKYESFQFIALLLAGILLTGLVRVYLNHRAILDHPNGRSSHVIPTPRGGGLAVTFLSVVALVLMGWQGLRPELFWLAGGAAALAAVSWIDDLRSLSARLRLLVQLVVAGSTLPWLLDAGSLTGGLLPIWLELPLATILWVGFINFFNFMDGIDGISGVEACSIGIGLYCLALGVGSATSVSPGLAIAAATLGFLIWNWHPARIFLGDVGSIPLGYLLGGLLLQLAAQGYWVPALILPSYYLTDAGLTLLRRLLRGDKVWQAHREHFYQKAVQRGHSHGEVSTAIALANIILIALALWAVEQPLAGLGGAVLTIALLIGWMKIAPRRRGETS